MKGRYDIVIFGATGFTGKHTIAAVERVCRKGGHDLTFAAAGRSKQKLEATLRSIGKSTGLPVEKWSTIIAEVEDQQSLRNMAKKAKVVINCCGPFTTFGEPVVKACIAEGTHHIDVAGEPLFMERLHLYYNNAAKEKEVYLVSACGVDCLLADMGVIFLQNNFAGTLNSVELYADLYADKFSTPVFSNGTWSSTVGHMGNFFEYSKIEKLTRPKNIPNLKPKLKTRWMPHTRSLIDKPACLLPSADPSMIEKSQAYLYDTYGIRPVQAQTYVVLASWFYFFCFLIGVLLISIMSQFEYTRALLLKYPRFFTMGFFDENKEPSEDALSQFNFRLTMFGNGWKDEVAHLHDQSKSLPNERIIGRIQGKHPEAAITPICLALSAKMILKEKEKMPKRGGVYSGGAAFCKTSLVEQLNDNDVKFEIISTPTNV